MTHRFPLRGGEMRERQGFFALTELQDFASGDIRPHKRP